MYTVNRFNLYTVEYIKLYIIHVSKSEYLFKLKYWITK